MGWKDERIEQLEEKVEHQRECIDWLKQIVDNLSSGKKDCCDSDGQ